MIPRKAVVRVCDHCKKPLGRERHAVLHEVDGEADEWVFCSKECLHEHFEHVMLDEIDRRVREEHNAIHKLVCPACKARVRRKG
jgi:hypothetical protein